MAKPVRTRPRSEIHPPAKATRTIWIHALLLAATVATEARTARFEFVNDPDYVTDNPHVRGGFTPENVAGAFAPGDAANWFPLTHLSHMLDYRLFGDASGGHHLTSVLLHAIARCFCSPFCAAPPAASG